MNKSPDLIERTQRMLDYATSKYGPESPSAKMLRQRLEQLKNPVSAQATFLQRAR